MRSKELPSYRRYVTRIGGMTPVRYRLGARQGAIDTLGVSYVIVDAGGRCTKPRQRALSLVDHSLSRLDNVSAFPIR